MKAISVELNRRTHFLKAARCSQTWSHGTGGCMCTSHIGVHIGTPSVCTLLSVYSCVLSCLHTVHACFSVSAYT